MRRSLLILPVVLSALALTACAGPTPEPTATVTETVSASPSASPSSTAQVDPNAPAGQCADSAIAVSIDDQGAGAGSIDYAVTFENTGSTPCELRGYPGVSVVKSGAQVGASAAETGASVETITIQPGASVSAALKAVNVADGGGPLGDSCQSTTGDAWQIYPPHSFVAVEVPGSAIAACANPDVDFLTVSPIAGG